jgi:hypothetical protein
MYIYDERTIQDNNQITKPTMCGGSWNFQMTEDKWIGSVNIILQPDTPMKTHLVVYIVDLFFSLSHTRYYLPVLTIRVTRWVSYKKPEPFILHENLGFCWVRAVVFVLFVFVLFLVPNVACVYGLSILDCPGCPSIRHGRHDNFYNLYSPLRKQNKRGRYF